MAVGIFKASTGERERVSNLGKGPVPLIRDSPDLVRPIQDDLPFDSSESTKLPLIISTKSLHSYH